jgi:hypothetical protein
MAGVTGQPQPVATGKSAGMMHQYPTLLGRPISRACHCFVPRCIPRKRDPGRLLQACFFLHTPLPPCFKPPLPPLPSTTLTLTEPLFYIARYPDAHRLCCPSSAPLFRSLPLKLSTIARDILRSP